MLTAWRLLALMNFLLTVPSVAGAAGPPPRRPLDLAGDPLPRGALARLGTLRLRHPADVSSVLFSRDGKTLISSAWQGRGIAFWDVRTGRQVRTLRGQQVGQAHLALSPDGRLLASVSAGANGVQVWDLPTAKVLFKFAPDEMHNQIATAFGKGGRTLLITGAGSVELRNLQSGKRIWQIEEGGWSPSVSPKGDRFAVLHGEARVHEMATGKVVWRFAPQNADFFHGQIAFSPCGAVVACGDSHGDLRLLDPATGKVLRQLVGHRQDIHALAFTSDGKLLASGDDNGDIRLWHWRTGKLHRRIEGHINSITCLDFSPNGGVLASGSRDQTVRLWDVRTGKELLPSTGHRSFVTTLAFSHDGRSLVSGGWLDGMIEWDVSARRQKRRLAGKGDMLTAVTFSPDQRKLVSAGWAGVLREYDWGTGKERRQLKGHGDRIYAVAYSPDGKTLASASIDSTIRLWDLAAGKERARLEGGAVWKWVTSLAFSPNGRVLASGREDGSIHLVSTATNKQTRRLGPADDPEQPRHEAWIAFAPDGRFIASASEDGKVRLVAAEEAGRRRSHHQPDPGSLDRPRAIAEPPVLRSKPMTETEWLECPGLAPALPPCSPGSWILPA